jgi:3-mercaptopyruvate sulfurtransferase SseA
VALLLRRRGIQRVRPLEGGLDSWRKLGFPMQSSRAVAPPGPQAEEAASD